MEQIELPESSISRRKGPKDNLHLPTKAHSLQFNNQAVQSLCVSKDRIFSGCEAPEIHVWDRSTYERICTLPGHTGGLTALLIVEDDSRNWLISSGGDGTVKVWCLRTNQLLLVIHPLTPGRIFSVVWSPQNSVLYMGCQSTSIQWVMLPPNLPQPSRPDFSSIKPMHANPTSARFFASSPQPSAPPSPPLNKIPVPQLTVDSRNSVTAHHGYVYTLTWVKDPSNQKSWLASASGAGDVRIWEQQDDCSLSLVYDFKGSYDSAVLSLACIETTLFVGMQDGGIKVIDLETGSIIRLLLGHEAPVLHLSPVDTDLYSASLDGVICRWNTSLECTACFQAHKSSILSMATAPDMSGRAQLVTGGSEGVHVWDGVKARMDGLIDVDKDDDEAHGDTLIYSLSKMVSYRTVSRNADRQHCRQGAIFLKNTLTQLGAEAELITGAAGKNPLVLARFTGKTDRPAKKRVLFYGHYDVVSAVRESWDSNPWTLDARNGYLYGRGVADNKGPILAMATAASTLLEQRSLEVDLVMLIEGEEETGSAGLLEATQSHRNEIGDVDVILVSNSSWIDEVNPCILYGLRGVVHVSIQITSDKADQHSGVEGGAGNEPMLDMVRLLATISDNERIAIPDFYESVRAVDEPERALYEKLAELTGRTPQNLRSRFCEPSFSIAQIGKGTACSMAGSTVIPSQVQASVSFRIVPDQDLESIASNIVQFLQSSFSSLQSLNHIDIKIPHKADYWLGDLSSPEHLLMERCIADVWGVPNVLRIREGGSVPGIRMLEKVFGANAVHVPLGQASDNAHLANERIRLLNLRRGHEVFRRFLRDMASS
ncbi:Metalloexopeptidases [Phaffia rhodozyma]|uniref:Metalloexopeptidases n=1 Tax=Phaffia rhodozyma TaxID=264483 RepID=A0A0F7SSZ2_PHARH|nr:Metalloexopeptidases [Phaffia rhodozyma]